MTYQELDTVPAYVQLPKWSDPSELEPFRDQVKWVNEAPPPAIGAEILVTINSCGPAIVTGYFVEGGWLGLRCRLTNPPAWHVKQNKGNPNGHVFGPEFRAQEA